MFGLFCIIMFSVLTLATIIVFLKMKPGERSFANWTGGNAVFALFLFFLSGLTVVPAGHVGVKDMFGSVDDQTLKPGVNYVSPFYNIEKMSIKTLELKENMSVPSREGLNVGLEISLLYHLDPEKANEIYKTVGPEYTSIIVIPQFRSIVRAITARFEAKALYSSGRDSLGLLIQEELTSVISSRGVIIESTPLRDLDLPNELTIAIERKLKSEQESEQMRFILTKEQQEAERKRIEAKGIADFQRIVSEGISEQLLKWKGIEATQDIAKSNNAKIVVIGSGKDGLPLILGN